MTACTLLVIEDNKDIADMISRAATQVGFEAYRANGSTALNAYDTYSPQVIVLDILMPDRDGIEILQFLKERKSQASIIILSGSSDAYRNIAEKLGMENGLKIVANIAKPFRIHEVKELLEKIGKSTDFAIKTA